MKILLAAVFTLSSITAFAKATYEIVPKDTKITYEGGKITGDKHTGNVTAKNGKLVVDGDKLVGGQIVVDMRSLTSTDITNEEYNKKYVGHMKSADFFNTDKYPEAKLVIKDSKKTEKGLEVSGDLTMIGQTNPVKFVVTDVNKTDSKFSGKTKLSLDRTKWGLKYGSGSFFKNLGDKTINDEFTLAVDVTAKK